MDEILSPRTAKNNAVADIVTLPYISDYESWQ
jgi:hypothetical protein